MSIEKCFDSCDVCGRRELDFVFVDLACVESNWVRDVPGFRCRNCHEILVSNGVFETLHDLEKEGGEKSDLFPIIKYQKQISKMCREEQRFQERYLHSLKIMLGEFKKKWSLEGFRLFGDWELLAKV